MRDRPPEPGHLHATMVGTMMAGTLRRGEQGDDIQEMQRKLNQAGYPVLVDGVFGPRTQAAVAAFLGDQGRTGDGTTLEEEGMALLSAVAANPGLRPKQISTPRRAATIAPTSKALESAHSDDLDAFGVDVEARAFARVICSRRTGTPLSIGLFGDWGAGKSYFMSKLQRQITARGEALERVTAALRAEGDEDELHTVEDLWHARIAQVTFNAWHFAEPNLWASLVTCIFDQMAELLNPEESVEDTRARLLAEVSEGQQRRKQAELELRKAEQVLSEARAESDVRERELEALREELAVVEAAAPVTGDDQGSTPGTVLRVKGPFAALRVSWRWIWSQGKWTRRAIIAGAILTVIGIVLAALAFWKIINLAPAIALGTSCVGVVTGLSSTLVAYWAIVQPTLAKARATYATVTKGTAAVGSFLDKAARDLLKPGTSALEVARRHLADAQAGVDSANAAASAASEQVGRARKMLQDLAGGQRFYAFIRDKGESDDYRQHLGLVSAIREDFEQLEQIMRQVEREGAGESGAPPPITRIVLYIDDLDRCEPDRVVEVLQAVHMLLATPIFVVVLAVDVRWLHQSLSLYFERMLGPQTQSVVEDDRPSPQSYLEKVFQVPFTLRPMGAEGFSALIDKVLDPGMPDDPPLPPIAPAEGGAATEAGASVPAPATARPPLARPSHEELRELTNDAELELGVGEIAFAKTLHAVIDTPRLAQALLNSYRVLRAEIPTEQVDEYLADGSYRIVLALLAIQVGRSRDAATLFEALAFTDKTALGEVVLELAHQTTSDAREKRWRGLADALREAGLETFPVAVIRPWLTRVRRFSFDPWPSQSF
ncbi:MAG: peptidoglycan-binding protein [Myxococcales bacterium]|nr:peptidoglycan-binding protein [Myxococcales bacterium]